MTDISFAVTNQPDIDIAVTSTPITVTATASGGDVTLSVTENDITMTAAVGDPVTFTIGEISAVTMTVTETPITISATAGLSDAPSDDASYVRKNAAWVAAAGVTSHPNLSNLSYANAGHTGFSPDSHAHAGVYQPAGSYLTAESDPVFAAWLALNPPHAAVTLDANADALLSLTGQALGLDTQAANLVLASAVSGGAAVPTFRALVAADIPALSYQPVDATLTSISALGAAGNIIYTTGVDTWAETAITADARLLLADADVPRLGTANTWTENQTIYGVTQPMLSVATASASVKVGAVLGLYPGIWLNQASPTVSNYAFMGTSTYTIFNAPAGAVYGGVYFGIGDTYAIKISSDYGVAIGTNFALPTLLPGQYNLAVEGKIGAGVLIPQARLHLYEQTTTANAIKEVQRVEAVVSTAATGGSDGMGAGTNYAAESATDGTSKLLAMFAGQYKTATAATFLGKAVIGVYDYNSPTTARVGLEIEATGSAVKIGFFGGTNAVQQALNAYTSDGEGSAYSGIDNLQVGSVYAQLTDLNALRVAYENVRAMVDDMRTKLQTSTIVA